MVNDAARPDGEAPLPPPPRVLLVEDDAVSQEVAAKMLEHLGCAVDVASDGAAAVDRALATAYDVVFMDCRMPGMDGLAATAEIRRREAGTRRVPIVAMTGNASPGDREDCLAAGMDDYVAKPMRLSDLSAVLARHRRAPRVA